MKLVQLKTKPGGICPDSGQGLGWQNACSLFRCQEWVNGKAMYPELVVRNGFSVCPKCHASYGAALSQQQEGKDR